MKDDIMTDSEKTRLQVENNEMDYLQQEYREDIDRLRDEIHGLEDELSSMGDTESLPYEEKLYKISIYDQIYAKRKEIKELYAKVMEMGTKSIMNDMIIDPEGEEYKRI
jgi:hypothetical protein